MSPVAGLVGWILALTVAIAARARAARKREQVARGCHELRGPITAARLALELGARSGGLTHGRLQALELELACAALALEDLGCASGTAPPVPSASRQPVNLTGLLNGVFEAWRGVAAAHGAELQLGAVPPAWLGCDERRVAQATGNLITNAAEHGGGVIELAARAEHGRVRIEVTDSGAGLPGPVAVLASRARAGRGARGRGLAIASAIAQAEGGRLAAAPSERGARLVLELPALSAEAALAGE